MVIFTLTLPALATLVQVGARRALESSLLAKASLECRSKLAEVTVGAEALDGTDWTPLLETNWFWKLDASEGAVDGLKQVQVSVKFDDGGASPVQVSLSQIIIDPANRGSTQDRAIIASLANSGSSASSGMSNAADPAASTNNVGTTNSGAAATPAATPSATPATGGGASKTGGGTGGGAASGAGGGMYGGVGGGTSPVPAGGSGKGGSR